MNVELRAQSTAAPANAVVDEAGLRLQPAQDRLEVHRVGRCWRENPTSRTMHPPAASGPDRRSARRSRAGRQTRSRDASYVTSAAPRAISRPQIIQKSRISSRSSRSESRTNPRDGWQWRSSLRAGERSSRSSLESETDVEKQTQGTGRRAHGPSDSAAVVSPFVEGG